MSTVSEMDGGAAARWVRRAGVEVLFLGGGGLVHIYRFCGLGSGAGSHSVQGGCQGASDVEGD